MSRVLYLIYKTHELTTVVSTRIKAVTALCPVNYSWITRIVLDYMYHVNKPKTPSIERLCLFFRKCIGDEVEEGGTISNS